jgi:glucosylceramidase
VDEATHHYTPTIDAYQLGQLSAFARTGAQRIATNNFVTYSYSGPNRNIASHGLDDVALRNPDGSIVLLAFNNAGTPISFSVADGNRYFSYRLEPGATATFTWR